MTPVLLLRPKPDVLTKATIYDGTRQSALAIVEWLKPPQAYYREGELVIHSADGPHTAEPGDWVLIDPRGFPYPVHPDVVDAKYDVVRERD
jgi:hypothetical protein